MKPKQAALQGPSSKGDGPGEKRRTRELGSLAGWTVETTRTSDTRSLTGHEHDDVACDLPYS